MGSRALHCSGGSVSWVERRGKSITEALEGRFSKAPREPRQRSCKGVKSRAQDPQEKGSGATDRRFLQTPQDTEPVTPWTGQEAAPAERREGGTIPLGMGSETPAGPGSQTQPSQAPREAPARGLHPPHLGSLDQPTLHQIPPVS